MFCMGWPGSCMSMGWIALQHGSCLWNDLGPGWRARCMNMRFFFAVGAVIPKTSVSSASYGRSQEASHG